MHLALVSRMLPVSRRPIARRGKKPDVMVIDSSTEVFFYLHSLITAS